jgi:hypothetical protein
MSLIELGVVAAVLLGGLFTSSMVGRSAGDLWTVVGFILGCGGTSALLGLSFRLFLAVVAGLSE